MLAIFPLIYTLNGKSQLRREKKLLETLVSGYMRLFTLEKRFKTGHMLCKMAIIPYIM